jgi:hypothetical protein
MDYESDLDLIVTTFATSGDEAYEGEVHLHDNMSGKLMKKIHLEEPWIEVGCTEQFPLFFFLVEYE